MRPVHQHGGQLIAASKKYQIPLAHWLDLSTGISPYSYPIAEIPEYCWQRLPETHDGLESAAARYYGSEYLLPVSGSQEAIQRLPLLRSASRVGIISPAYHSHEKAWRQAGHQVVELNSYSVDQSLSELDVLLLVNPNNPTTEFIPRQQLLDWHSKLAEQGGWLIVDEAYMDCAPQNSLIQAEPIAGMIVLRSIGKFFGLAGIRLGFVWAEEALLQGLVALQDDWSVSHPARWVGKQALSDIDWQMQQRQQLMHSGQTLKRHLQNYYTDAQVQSTHLFAYLRPQNAQKEYERLAQQGILVRYFDQPNALRFGLPKTNQDWDKLLQAIGHLY